MDVYYMPSTRRHIHLVGSLFSDVKSLLIQKMLLPLIENSALLFYGSLREPHTPVLIDANEITTPVWDLEYVMPDFMIFHKNPYISNEKGTKFIGCPDLIVEVWSDSNTDSLRQIKQLLYSTSPKTEHWYITQDSNTVKCWHGKKLLNDQTLTQILKTKGGLEFDLRYLALQDDV